MNWFYAVDEESTGPLDDEAFQAKVADGTITGDTMVWHDAMTEWQAYSSIPAEQPAESADLIVEHEDSGEAQCCECSTTLPLDDMIQYEGAYVCAGCKTVFFQRLQEGGALPGVVAYGGFWIRVGAKMIDGVILGAVSMLLSLVLAAATSAAAANNATGAMLAVQMVQMAIQMLVGLSYTVFFLGRFAATPGKMVCKLKVIRSDGAPVTYPRAVGRHFAEILSGLILNIGYLLAAFDDEKRTLHDHMCDTRVIKVQ
jgi:uncharacterized RDD family membrane protein YckC